MEDNYGSDFITVTDEDGIEYEFEVLTSIEYCGATYVAVIPVAENSTEDIEISILKSVEDGDESVLCTIDDDKELEAVYSKIMDSMYDD